jgi:hypothetical protein
MNGLNNVTIAPAGIYLLLLHSFISEPWYFLA